MKSTSKELRRILYTASTDLHILTFHIPYLKWFKEHGYEVHVASRGSSSVDYCDFKYDIPFVRSPIHIENLKAFRMLRKLINSNEYDLIHCHTPIGGVLTRIAAASISNKNIPVFYTAHGFHFYEGAPLYSWLLYYPIEKLLSFFTLSLITINKEDFNLANARFNCKVFKIHGIGIDESRFKLEETDKKTLRKKHGFSEDDFILIYIAEFISRKNHKFIIDACSDLSKEIDTLKVIFLGKGVLMEDMKQRVYHKCINNVFYFKGFQRKLEEYIRLSDVAISSSLQEGLGLGLAECMYCGLPVIATEDRGHRELVVQGENGYLFKQGDRDQFSRYVSELYLNVKKRLEMGRNAFQRSLKFSLAKTVKEMEDIYQEIQYPSN